MSGDSETRPYRGSRPACKREYRYAIVVPRDGVIRGHLSGDICITSDLPFAHSEMTVADSDGEFPTKEVGGMGNRREVPVETTDVSGVEVAADGEVADVFTFPDDED